MLAWLRADDSTGTLGTGCRKLCPYPLLHLRGHANHHGALVTEESFLKISTLFLGIMCSQSSQTLRLILITC